MKNRIEVNKLSDITNGLEEVKRTIGTFDNTYIWYKDTLPIKINGKVNSIIKFARGSFYNGELEDSNKCNKQSTIEVLALEEYPDSPNSLFIYESLQLEVFFESDIVIKTIQLGSAIILHIEDSKLTAYTKL